MQNRPLRLSIPSKGRLSEDSLNFLAACGLEVYKPNPRQYEASIPSVPELTVLFQRPTDIVISVRNGSVDFGITGLDVLAEYRGPNGDILPLHSALGFGTCTLDVIVPDTWSDVDRMDDLPRKQAELGRPLRVATKFTNAAEQFFAHKGLSGINFIDAEGTLEIAPTIGYADLIADLVSTGTTLRDNHLKRLEDGEILSSQACLIANRAALKDSKTTPPRSPSPVRCSNSSPPICAPGKLLRCSSICAEIPPKPLPRKCSPNRSSADCKALPFRPSSPGKAKSGTLPISSSAKTSWPKPSPNCVPSAAPGWSLRP